MIRFPCPNCGKAQTAPDANAGETGSCSYCDELFDIPRPRGSAPGRPAGILRLVCPGCDKTLGVPATAAGKPCDCPACGTKFLVPADAEPEPAPAPKPRPRPAPPPSPSRRPEPRRPRDEDDDEPVSRGRRVDDDDEDDEPVSRGRRVDDEDEDDDDRPSRRSKSKPKKRRKSRGGGGLPEWYRGPLGRLAENAVITLVLALIALFSPALSGGLLIAWGFTLSMVGSIWSLVVAAREGIDQLLLCLFIPFYWVYYLISRWDDVKHPGTLYLIGFGQYMIGCLLFLAPLMAMIREANANR